MSSNPSCFSEEDQCFCFWRRTIWPNYYNFRVAGIRFISNPNLKDENNVGIRLDRDMLAMDMEYADHGPYGYMDIWIYEY